VGPADRSVSFRRASSAGAPRRNGGGSGTSAERSSPGGRAYTAEFATYDKTWGSVAAVIVTLTWLWLNSIAILFAAELNAEIERAREIHTGTPVER
jgi:hypothetical protein